MWGCVVYGWGGSMLYDWDVWCDVYVCIGYIVEYIMMEVWVMDRIHDRNKGVVLGLYMEDLLEYCLLVFDE